jgi:hypothetical protein
MPHWLCGGSGFKQLFFLLEKNLGKRLSAFGRKNIPKALKIPAGPLIINLKTIADYCARKLEKEIKTNHSKESSAVKTCSLL